MQLFAIMFNVYYITMVMLVYLCYDASDKVIFVLCSDKFGFNYAITRFSHRSEVS